MAEPATTADLLASWVPLLVVVGSAITPALTAMATGYVVNRNAREAERLDGPGRFQIEDEPEDDGA